MIFFASLFYSQTKKSTKEKVSENKNAVVDDLYLAICMPTSLYLSRVVLVQGK